MVPGVRLGPKIEDQFDELDARYLKREGSEEFHWRPKVHATG